MAQNDMNIANQGFPAFRADLNDALGALVSNSSGATAPATTFAHQLWVDTSANPSVLKIRNADNDAFITIGTINQTGDTFKLTPAGGVSTDTISELTAAAGVTIDGVLLKDSEVSTDVIKEKTSAAGVTIDGVLLKDTTVTANTVKASGTASSQGKVEFFEDTDNGTNFVALQAAAAIASDVTFTLPAADGTSGQALVTNGSGTLSFATAGGGKVLQVVSTTKTDTFSSASFTYVDLTGLSVSITPTSATSKIYAMVTLSFCSESGGRLAFQLVRGSTAVGIGDASGGRTTASSSGGPTSPATTESTSFSFLDSPNTTSATTYKVQLRGIDTSVGVLYYVNRSVNDEDNASRPRTASTITVMEIAA